MKLKNLTKEELSLLSYSDIANLILEEENGGLTTLEIIKIIIGLLDLPSSTIDNKIGDLYTAMTTDKRFVPLKGGIFDLRSRHTSDKIIIPDDTEEEIEEEGEEVKDEVNDLDEIIEEIDDFDTRDQVEEEEFEDDGDDLSDLVILDEEEIELEQ